MDKDSIVSIIQKILIFCIIIYHLILEMILFNLVSCNYDHLIIYVDLIIEIDVESEQNLWQKKKAFLHSMDKDCIINFSYNNLSSDIRNDTI